MGERGPIASGEGHSDAGVVAVGLGSGWSVVPAAPPEVRPALAESWTAYFESPVARVAHEVDLYVLSRLWRTYELWEQAFEQLVDEGFVVEKPTRKDRVIEVTNPKVSALTAFERIAENLEKRLGISPESRARLGIKVAQVQQAAAAAATKTGEPKVEDV